jgi:ABC-type dipeptide/oligopeptide/nickel transport system permease subunit
MAAEESLIRTPPRPSTWERTWKSVSIIFESHIATVGLLIVVFWIIVGIISLFWTPFPVNQSLFTQQLPPNTVFLVSFAIVAAGIVGLTLSNLNQYIKLVGIPVLVLIEIIVIWWLLQGASPNLLGTDNLGRDILSRIMVGTQPILLKTDLPPMTLGNYFIIAAVIAFLVSLLGPVALLSALAQAGRRLHLFILAAVWLVASIILFLVLPDAIQISGREIAVTFFTPFFITLAILYVGLFIFGWIRAKALGLSEPMRAWTISLAITIGLAVLGSSNFLQSIDLPRVSLPIGVAIWGVIGSLVVGSILGLNAGYRGGWWDQTIMQGLDALIAFPVIVLYLVLIGALAGAEQETRALVVILAITVTGTPGVARLVRSLALDIKTRDYIRAAETRGETNSYIMMREILPNARGPVLVDAMLRVGYAIFAIGTLGFLGLGLPPPDPDWGTMVADARQFIFANPAAVIWPAIAVASLVIGLNFFADGLREELTRYQK